MSEADGPGDDDWRFRPVEPDDADLYVHLSADGGIFVAPGHDLRRSAWITVADLERHVAAVPPAARLFLHEPEPSPLTAGPSRLVRDALTTVIEAGALPGTRRPDDHPAILTMAADGAVSLVRDLLDRGVPVDATDPTGATALHAAAHAGQVASLDVLLEAGAEVDRPDHEGTTPLMMAAWAGRSPAVRRLLEAGADPTLTRPGPDRALTAADLARGVGHDSTAALLEAVVRTDDADEGSTVGPRPGSRVVYRATGPDGARSRTLVLVALGVVVPPLLLGGLVVTDEPLVVVGLALAWLVVVVATVRLTRQERTPVLVVDGSQVRVEPARGPISTFDLRHVASIGCRGTGGAGMVALRFRLADGGVVSVVPRLHPPEDATEAALLGPLAARPEVVAEDRMAERLLARHRRNPIERS